MSDQYGFDKISLYAEIGQPTWLELLLVEGGASGISVHREMVDPSAYPTVGSLVLVYSSGGGHTFTIRNRDGSLEPAGFGDATDSKMTVVHVIGDLDPDGVAATIRALPIIMPSRMTWKGI